MKKTTFQKKESKQIKQRVSRDTESLWLMERRKNVLAGVREAEKEAENE